VMRNFVGSSLSRVEALHAWVVSQRQGGFDRNAQSGMTPGELAGRRTCGTLRRFKRHWD